MRTYAAARDILEPLRMAFVDFQSMSREAFHNLGAIQMFMKFFEDVVFGEIGEGFSCRRSVSKFPPEMYPGLFPKRWRRPAHDAESIQTLEICQEAMAAYERPV